MMSRQQRTRSASSAFAIAIWIATPVAAQEYPQAAWEASARIPPSEPAAPGVTVPVADGQGIRFGVAPTQATDWREPRTWAAEGWTLDFNFSW